MAARSNLTAQAEPQRELMDLAVNPNAVVGIPNLPLRGASPNLICIVGNFSLAVMEK